MLICRMSFLISWTGCKISVLCMCLACGGQGRRVEHQSYHGSGLKEHEVSPQHEGLALLLRTLDPTAQFQTTPALHGVDLHPGGNIRRPCLHVAQQSAASFATRARCRSLGMQQSETAVPVLQRPSVQLPLLLASYMVQVLWLARQALPFFKALLPETEVVAENVVAAAILTRGVTVTLRKRRQQQRPAQQEGEPGAGEAGEAAPISLKLPAEICSKKTLLADTAVGLIVAHLISGYFNTAADIFLNCLAVVGVPMTFNQKYALQVLLSYLTYVWMSVKLLGWRLKPFFPPPFGKGSWLRVRWRTDWLGWVIGGYYTSVLGYNFVEELRHAIMGPDSDPDIIVSRLIRPGGGDLGALAIGFIAPCAIAPILEEVVYRGFLLRALTCFMPLRAALPVHALLFGLHHVVGGRAPHVVLPLAALAWFWGWLYAASNNLLVPILIHAMFNSRGFIESLLEGQY